MFKFMSVICLLIYSGLVLHILIICSSLLIYIYVCVFVCVCILGLDLKTFHIVTVNGNFNNYAV